MLILHAKGNPDKFLYLEFLLDTGNADIYRLHNRSGEDLGVIHKDGEGFYCDYRAKELLNTDEELVWNMI